MTKKCLFQTFLPMHLVSMSSAQTWWARSSSFLKALVKLLTSSSPSAEEDPLSYELFLSLKYSGRSFFCSCQFSQVDLFIFLNFLYLLLLSFQSHALAYR